MKKNKIKEYRRIASEMSESHAKDTLVYLLDHKSITSMEAFLKLKNTRLSASIFVLRYKYNIPINTDMVYKENGARYGVYTIGGE